MNLHAVFRIVNEHNQMGIMTDTLVMEEEIMIDIDDDIFYVGNDFNAFQDAMMKEFGLIGFMSLVKKQFNLRDTLTFTSEDGRNHFATLTLKRR